MSEINCVLADVQSIFRTGLKALFEHGVDVPIRIVGQEDTAEGLLLFLHKNLNTNLVIMDLNLPDQDGLELIPQIRRHYRSLKILVLTAYGDYKFVGQALKNGADGYILKSNEKDDLLEGIIRIMEGQTYIAPGLHITPPNGKRLNNGRRSTYEDRFVIKQRLTNRELEVLELIIQAKNNKEIAQALFISDQTVGVHRKNIMRKLGVKNTINLIKFAIENQLV